MQLRRVLEAELDPWAGLDAASSDELWDDEVFDSEAGPGSDDELAAAERWLEAHPLDADDEAWLEGQAIALDSTNELH